jgi:hypothetical protein
MQCSAMLLLITAPLTRRNSLLEEKRFCPPPSTDMPRAAVKRLRGFLERFRDAIGVGASVARIRHGRFPGAVRPISEASSARVLARRPARMLNHFHFPVSYPCSVVGRRQRFPGPFQKRERSLFAVWGDLGHRSTRPAPGYLTPARGIASSTTSDRWQCRRDRNSVREAGGTSRAVHLPSDPGGRQS